MNEHDECDHDGPTQGFYAPELPCWKFSIWDVAGIVTFTAAGVMDRLANGLGLMAREFQASANRSRQEHDLRMAESQRADAAEALRALVEGPEATS